MLVIAMNRASATDSRERERALAGRERLQRRAGGGVALAAARVAAGHPVVRRVGGARRVRAGRPAGAYGCAANGHLQPLAQRAGGGLRVRGVGDRAHDDDPARAARGDLADVAGVEPADREPRRGDVRGGPVDVLEPGGRAPGLRRRRVHRPDREVVDVRVGVGRRALLRRMRRAADDPVRPGGRARRRRRCRRPGRRGRRPRAHAATRSGRSLRMNSAPARPRRRGTPAPRRSARRRRASCRAAGRRPPRRAAPRPGTPAGARRRRGTAGPGRCGREGAQGQGKQAPRARLRPTYGSPLPG